MLNSCEKPVNISCSHTTPLAFSSQAKGSSLTTKTEDSPPLSLKILVAEDEPISRLFIAKVLTKLGHDVKSVKNGKEVLDLLAQKESFDALFTDIQMPELDGMELANILRSDRTYQAIAQFPIIAMTAYAMSGDRETFLKAGMDDYLPKPIDPKLLEIILEQIGAKPH